MVLLLAFVFCLTNLQVSFKACTIVLCFSPHWTDSILSHVVFRSLRNELREYNVIIPDKKDAQN